MTREEAIKWLEYSKQGEIGKAVEAADMAIKVLEQEPKTGHWKKWEYGTHRCSICDKFIGRERYPYCPYCGAKMVEPQERSGE